MVINNFMKKTAITLFTLTILITLGCKDTSLHSPLAGKWRVVGYSTSAGGPPVYYPVDKGSNYYVQFNDNGILRSNYYEDYGQYAIKDNSTLIITNDDTKPNYYATHGYKTYTVFYSFKKDTLIISPPCIEGCSTKFVRY